MVKVNIDICADGYLKYLRVTGHIGKAKRGKDLVCAAITCLVRTTAHVLHAQVGVDMQSQAPDPGILEIQVNSLPKELKKWAKGVTEFLLTGIFDIKKEFSDSIEINFLNNGELRRIYGS